MMAAVPVDAFDLQGHRGARGLAPENTLAAFARALEIGVTTLETDLAVTRDGVLVLSHDPVLNPDIVRGPDGNWLAAPGPAINSLTLAELKRFDIGRIDPSSKYAQQFPDAEAGRRAALPDAGRAVRTGRASGKARRFNIETKLSPDKPAEARTPKPSPAWWWRRSARPGSSGRATIQSFDWRTLLAAKTLAPEIETVCLTYDRPCRTRSTAATRRPSPWLAGLDPADYGGSVPRLAAAAGCGTWSPTSRAERGARGGGAGLGLKVVPWTVNARRRHGAHHRHEGGRPDHRLPRPRPRGDGREGRAPALSYRRLG